MVIAADSGARHAQVLGLTVDLWVGDGDSLASGLQDALESAGVQIQRAPVEKDATDGELALLAAVAAGATRVTIIGGLGGSRIDHALANVEMLGHPLLSGQPTWMYDRHAARVSMLVAPDATGGAVTREFGGRPGDLVSLIASGVHVAGVTTDGLRYPLDHEPLRLGTTRGVSNVRTGPVARITMDSGRLLVIETPATVRP